MFLLFSSGSYKWASLNVCTEFHIAQTKRNLCLNLQFTAWKKHHSIYDIVFAWYDFNPDCVQYSEQRDMYILDNEL